MVGESDAVLNKVKVKSIQTNAKRFYFSQKQAFSSRKAIYGMIKDVLHCGICEISDLDAVLSRLKMKSKVKSDNVLILLEMARNILMRKCVLFEHLICFIQPNQMKF